jgi:hypothetical protein
MNSSPHEFTESLPDDGPDFDLPHRDAIHEDNWAEFEAKGFGVATGWSLTDLAAAERWFGIEHVYTGDAFDRDQNRPLRHKPGMAIYVDPEGLAIGARKWKQWLKEHSSAHDDEGGPSKS